MTELTLFQQKLSAQLPDVELKFEEPLSLHTSFRIGGPAEVMAFPKNDQELAAVFKVSDLMDCDPLILGAGTNVLAPDAGIRGLVICLKDCFNGIDQLSPTVIRVMAGVTMTRAALFAANLGLSGLEFAHGIPGTVGGGVYMNAGAYGSEISQVCTGVRVMDRQGNTHIYTNEDMDFSYRHSCLENTNDVVISADFTLTSAPEDQIRGKMQELMGKRKASQPLDLPSAGSAFKRPVGGYAAALIDKAGLKGYQVGGAAVSGKHAGFVVNIDRATAEDVKALLRHVADQVYALSEIRLEPEVRIW